MSTISRVTFAVAIFFSYSVCGMEDSMYGSKREHTTSDTQLTVVVEGKKYQVPKAFLEQSECINKLICNSRKERDTLYQLEFVGLSKLTFEQFARHVCYGIVLKEDELESLVLSANLAYMFRMRAPLNHLIDVLISRVDYGENGLKKLSCQLTRLKSPLLMHFIKKLIPKHYNLFFGSKLIVRRSDSDDACAYYLSSTGKRGTRGTICLYEKKLQSEVCEDYYSDVYENPDSVRQALLIYAACHSKIYITESEVRLYGTERQKFWFKNLFKIVKKRKK